MKIEKIKNYNLILFMNSLGLFGINLALLIAFYYQLFHSELPCPLCLLQRVGFILAGFGFLFNIHRGINNSHYSLIIFAAIATGFVSFRQVLLHILPKDPGFGSSLFGLHFYSLVLLGAISLIMLVLLIIIISEATINLEVFPLFSGFSGYMVLLFIAIIILNLISTFLECGFRECPSDPVNYLLLNKW